jgi:hypothetical protein
MRLELHVQELVLDGVSPADRDRIGASVIAELQRLAATGAIPDRFTADAHLPVLNGGPVTLGSAPGELGVAIARAVHGAVAGGKE